MNEQKKATDFSYTYSAKEQEELKKIREKYIPREENKMERLRRLDAGVAKKARSVSLILGVVGSLLLGFGMSLIMTELSAILGTNRDMVMPLGITVGILGSIMIGFAYPIYQWVSHLLRRRIAPEILRLTDELMK